MQKDIRELVVFIASPSDLADERQIIRSTGDELNHVLSACGIRLRVVGWELTLPGYGRPQERINPMVRECDVFIGLLNKRWGTATGERSSGFEEEFEIALERRKNDDGSPAIGMFFAKIDDESLSDPGPQLSQVIEFRTKVKAERIALYGEFSNADQLGKIVSNFLLEQVLPFALEADSGPSALEATGTSTPNRGELQATPKDSESEQPPNAAAEQLAEVLGAFTSIMTGNKNEGTKLDLDRLALFARACERELEPLGAHLVNRLYGRLDDLQLTELEGNIWLRTFFTDIGRSTSSEERTIPGWALLDFKDGDRQDRVERRLVDFTRIDDERAVRGALKVMTSLNLRPVALWQRPENAIASTDHDDVQTAWTEIFAVLPGVESAFNYLVSQFRPDDIWLVRSLSQQETIDESTKEALRAFEEATNGDFAKLASLAPYSFAKNVDAISEYLATHIDRLPSERLEWVARFAAPHLRRAAVSKLLAEGKLKDESLRQTLAWKDRETIQLLSTEAASDPTFGEVALEIVSNSSSSHNFPPELEPRLLAALRTTEQLQALVESSPFNYEHWHALTIKVGEDMLEESRQILDTDAASWRGRLAPSMGDNPTTLEYVAGKIRAYASECIGNNGEGGEDALRLVRELDSGQLVGPSQALVALSKIARPELLSTIQEKLPALDASTFIDVAEVAMASDLAPALAQVWNTAETRNLREASRQWFLRQPERTHEELREALHFESPGERMTALDALAKRYSNDELRTLLVEYVSAKTYWYNVIAGIDELLYGVKVITDEDSRSDP
ncbi:hypothetical protein ABIB48_003539 [Arthrobacter sp. UYCu511]|uniref:DUF4062 domain-containing protein n=1 Tax=Arthrobacter sp. UYCu511 TaxID=3156337 RepID=UPI003396981B